MSGLTFPTRNPEDKSWKNFTGTVFSAVMQRFFCTKIPTLHVENVLDNKISSAMNRARWLVDLCDMGPVQTILVKTFLKLEANN